MARQKTQQKKTKPPVNRKKHKLNYPLESLPDVSPGPSADFQTPVQPVKQNRTVIATGLLISAIILVLLVKNGLVVSAVINGSPIYAWQLHGRLMSRFGSQTLEGMITEKLIADASRNAGVVVSQEDITARQTEMLKSVGESVTLDDLLKYQGITKEDFQSQLKLQLSVEKILGKDITVSDADITQYIASYSSRMEASTEAGLREEAKKALFDQQISQKVNTWFSELKNKARIMRFL